MVIPPDLHTLATAFFFLVGVVFGSFGNVVIIRGIEERSLRGRSACPHCSKILRFIDLIPILSFLFLKGRCRHCEAKISWQYPLVEIASGLLFVGALWHDQFSLIAAGVLAMCLWLLLLIAVMDMRTGMIADALSIPLIGFAVVRAFLFGFFPWQAAAFALAFFGLQWLYSRGGWLGSGDILLALGIAILLQRFDLFLFTVFLAYILGALVAIFLLATKKKTMQSSLPFGPFLTVACIIALFCGDRLLGTILG